MTKTSLLKSTNPKPNSPKSASREEHKCNPASDIDVNRDPPPLKLAEISSDEERAQSNAPRKKKQAFFPMEMKLGDFIPIVISSSPDQTQEPRRKKINWGDLFTWGKNWAREPINMALLLWLSAVGVCLFILFLLMTGLLNNVVHQSSQRKIWIEALNQIVNALFAIVCLYQHPKLSHHLFLLLRWSPGDGDELWAVYSNNRKPNSDNKKRAHLCFVIVLLHVTCCAQYVICGLFWVFHRSTRPDAIVNAFIGVGVFCPVVAGAYTLFGPLRSRGGETAAPLKTLPERDWAGGVYEFCEDTTVGWLSLFCTIFVFGWNMERLGFGNKYVHVATFALVFVAPFLVFSAAAMKIEVKVVKEMMVISGVVLSCCGFVYGGYWRTQMRRKMKLPASYFCCGIANFSDCFLWVFCWACSLAQEVRTGSFYGVEVRSPAKEEEGAGVGGRVHPLSVAHGGSGSEFFSSPRPLTMSAQC
ncbi:uncharacterized protein LOC144706915 [Wolffia australiana]